MNRIASEADKKIYGEYITVGDLIIDSPTKIYEDGSKEVVYYFMGSKHWKQLRENGTIWIDGDQLGFIKDIVFRNTAKDQTPWHINSAIIKPIPNTQVIAGSIVCHGLKNWILDGVSEKYQGLLIWNPERKFLTGNFGFHIKNTSMFSSHGIEGSVLSGGTILLKGFEAQFGFSGVRLCGSAVDSVIHGIDISNFYIHDTAEGEGFYIGSTQTGPKAKLKNVKIKNGIIARTAAEAIQIQHMAGDCEVNNIVIYAADTNWLCAFMAGQSTGIQWVNASGINKLYNIIVDGFAANGYMPFGSDQNISLAPDGKSVVENILFNDGRNSGMYLHNTAKNGLNWHYRDIYYRAFNNTYYDRTGEKNVPHIISRKWGTDPIFFERIIHDGSKSKVFEDTKGITVGDVVLDTTIPAPKYLNSGFGNMAAHKIKIWHQYFGSYFDGPNYTPTHWDVDDIAIDAREDGTYVFCKCLEAHITPTGTTVRPKENSKFQLLTWDINGVRSDLSNWMKDSVQSYFPPDDLRLASDCFWKSKGMGVQGIIQREDILDEYVFNGERVTITDKATYKNKI